jgi:hypothetical protein
VAVRQVRPPSRLTAKSFPSNPEMLEGATVPA